MLGKTSVSMMVLLVVVAASLIGISSIHQYVEGQRPPAGRAVGNIIQLTTYAPVAGCTAPVELSPNVPNGLGLKPGESILLFSEREYLCFTWCVENKRIWSSCIPSSKNDSFKPTSSCTSGSRAFT